VNLDMVELDPLDDEDRQVLRHAVTRHEKETGSTVARDLLADWSHSAGRFTKVMPTDYKRVLLARARAIEAGLDADAAVMEAVRG
jgi:glutamate synthase (NADPH/NADH) large chain